MSKYFALWVCLFLLIGLSILYSIAEVILLGASKLCMCVLAQSCLTLCNPTNCGWPARLLFHKIFQVRILEWVAISSSRGSSWSRDQTRISCVSYIVGRFFTTCPMWEACWQILNCYAVVQSLSHVYLFANPWNTVCQASLSFTLPEFAQTHVHWVDDTTQPSPPLLPSYAFAFNLSQHLSLLPMNRLFTSGGQSIGTSASAFIEYSNEYSGLISFSIDWFDLLAVQETFKSLLQHHSSKASILQRSAFLMVQLSHSCMTTGKIIALTTWTFVSKVMSLLFSMLSGFVITFFPRSKRLLILWLQSLYAVTLEPKKIKSALFLLFPYLGKLLNI